MRLLTLPSDELDAARFEELTRLCEAAFGEPFPRVWDRVGPGLHVMAEDERRLAAHAMIVDRQLYVGHEADQAIDAGYVENVATRPDLQGRGFGAAVMREINRIIGEEYALGALATGSNDFYLALGWETWVGPTWVRMADGERIRSADQEGHVMVLRTARTPAGLRLDLPIAVDWRPGEAW